MVVWYFDDGGSVSQPRFGWGPINHASNGRIARLDDDEEIFVKFDQGVWRGRQEEMEKGVIFKNGGMVL